jgi:hypothetical protein
VVFYGNKTLYLNSLMCYQTAFFLTRFICIANNNKVLDCFAPFVVRFVIQDVDVNKAIQVK